MYHLELTPNSFEIIMALYNVTLANIPTSKNMLPGLFRGREPFLPL
jgi:hypothetical protein